MLSRRLSLFVVVVTAALVVAGGVLASNMAFTLNYRLNASAANGGVGTGKNALALPYMRQPGVDNAYQLMMDIGSGSILPVDSVSRFNTAGNVFETYTGRMGSPLLSPFALTPGEGLFVKMVSNVNYVVVGAHDPASTFTVPGPGPGSATGASFFALPYNATVSEANQLMKDIGGGTILPVSGVAKFLPASDSYLVYTGRMGSPQPFGFALKPGEPYFVNMHVSVSYTPSHY